MRELDSILQAFLQHSFSTLDDEDKSRFERILDLPDPELHGYLLGRVEPSDRHYARLIGLIRNSLHPQS